MAVSMYAEYDRQAREAAYLSYISADDFSSLAAAAIKRGYRHAELGEIHASAEKCQYAPDLFSWRGGLWVKHEKTE